MKRHHRIRAFLHVSLVSLVLLAPSTLGDTYSAGTAATVGEISSSCQATWLSQSRTTIGIAERVTCTIEPATWSDTDCNETTGQFESDTIGTISWTKDGLGAKTVSPDTGSSTTFVASSLVGPATGTVKARVWDSKTKYTEYVDKEKSFTVLSPTGEIVTLFADDPPFHEWEPGHPKGIAARTFFERTLQPTSVTFQYARLSESEGSTWAYFPDGTHVWTVASGNPQGPFNFD